MRSLRNHRYWLALLLVLAMVFTMGGGPANAAFAACGVPGPQASPVLAAPPDAAAPACEMAPGEPCCCGSGSTATLPASHEQHCAPLPGECDCSLQVPNDPPAAAPKAPAGVSRFDAALPPRAAVELSIRVRVLSVQRTPDPLFPPGPERAAAPSRAPPAC